MELELAAFLRLALLRAGATETDPRVRTALQRGATSFSWRDIQPAPTHVPADLSSAFAFQIAAHLHRLDGLRIEPEQLVARVVTAAQELASGGEPFSFDLSGSGHLNVRIGDRFREEFLISVLYSRGELLFEREPIVLRRSNLFLSEAPSIFDVGAKTVPERFSIDWNRELLRARDSQDEDLRKFAALLQGKGELMSGEKIMLLMALGDRELDLTGFRERLHTRENIPWFLGKFFEDARCVAAKLALEDTGPPRASFPPPGLSFVTADFWAALSGFLSFRPKLLTALTLQRGELLLGAALDFVRAFYRLYNRPNIRALQHSGANRMRGRRSDRGEGELRVGMRYFAETVRNVLLQSLALLEFSCDESEFCTKS